ncbi:MAG: FkbM family methyltransferase [Bryobacterales bacterium]|nr:FkbM family methyltransferase [Bryobacterales bacterium]
MSEKRTRVKRRIRPLAGIPLVLLAAAGLYVAGVVARSGAVVAMGQANGCSLARVLPIHAVQAAITNWRLLRDTKVEPVMGTDLVVHRTPVRDFYAPKGSALQFVLTEQLTHVYGDGEYRVRPGDVVLDCGANTGTFVHEALTAGASKVVAVDPSPGNVEAMKRTFAKEIAEGRVVVYAKGVWDKDDFFEMNIYTNSALDSFVMKTRDEVAGQTPVKVRLPLTTIDKMVAELGLGKVDYIKMDIEGAERQAISGAAETIRKFRPRMSIATENLDDDYLKVPEAVLAIRGDYKSTCLLCRDLSLTSARPDIVHFN